MAMAGCGALLGAVSLAVREGIRGLGRWITVGSAIFELALILFSFSQSFWVSAIILLAVGASMVVVLAACNTLLQSMVPDELRGRVMALYSMFFMGSAPLGALAAGFIADHWSAPVVVALGGSCCIVGAAIFGFSLPALRKDARQLLLSLEAAGGIPAQQVTSQAISDD